jgi:hypothetical protein
MIFVRFKAPDLFQVISPGVGLESMAVQYESRSMFSEAKISSMNANTVALEVSLDMLIAAMRSCAHGGAAALTSSVVWNLVTRMGVPHLHVKITSMQVALSHEVPARVLAKAENVEFCLPPEPQLQFTLPSMKDLKMVCERLTVEYVTFHVPIIQRSAVTQSMDSQGAGHQTIGIELAGDAFSFRADFKDLRILIMDSSLPRLMGSDQHDGLSSSSLAGGRPAGPAKQFSFRVARKNLLKILQAAQLNPVKSILSLTVTSGGGFGIVAQVLLDEEEDMMLYVLYQ